MAYPIKNVVSCTSYTATISAIDINSATGNSNPTFNGKVFVTITPCPGDLNNVMVFTTAGVFQNAFCADELGAVYYYQNNNLYLTINSTASEQGFCFSALTNTNIIKTGNFALGVNQGGYGPTSSTAFWNGRPPNVSGYTAYVGNGTSSPTMYVVPDDSQLITLSNTLGGGSNTTIQLALNYFINSANSVCLNVEPPNIVTNGLVVYLDAGFTPSYPKGFNTWYDTSQNLNNGVLTNGPTYNSADGGSLVFDGIDDKVVLPHILNYNLTNLTALVWIKPTSPYTSSFRNIISKEGADRDWNFYLYSSASNGVVNYYHFSTARASSYPSVVSIPGGSLSLDVWHQCGFSISNGVLTYYLDGVVIASGAINFSSANSSYPISIGGADNYTKGNIMTSQVYNRGLTDQEVLQNYYAGLQRFIPTDNMVLWLDGTNTNTRVITPTTAYDRSGGNYNGTLNNGVTLSHRDGGTVFSFDGVDDYIAISNPLNQSNLTQVWSVSVWVKQNTGTSGPQYIINGLNNGIASDWYGNGPLLYLNGGVNDYYTYTSTYASIAGTGWRHLVYLFQNSTGLRQIYKDGVLSGNSNGPNNTSTPSGQGGTWYIGQMSGKIGDVRIYSRVLTASEISTIYNAGRARYGV